MAEDDPYFRVDYSGRAIDSLKDIGRRARLAGRVEETRQALRLMHDWLRADPESLGEPVQDFADAEQTEYVGVVAVLLVRYTIHVRTRQVFVSRPVELVRWAGF